METKKKAVRVGGMKATLVDTLVHIFLAVLSFIWVLPIVWIFQK